MNGDSDSLATFIKNILLSSLNYYDFNNEKNYQIMFGTLFALILTDCNTKFEVISGTGRCDIMLANKREGSFGAVIEIKYHSKQISYERLSNSASTALKQIQKNEYVDELMRKNADPIYAYGFAFMKNKVAIKSMKLR